MRAAALASVVITILAGGRILAQSALNADVVVLSDTSATMSTNDPKNAVVLVTRLFADIVPGKLAAVRLFDLSKDQSKVPNQQTNEKKPCPDRPSEMCSIVRLGPDAWDKAIEQKLVLSVRPSRGDSGFKSSLVELLKPSSMETDYMVSWGTIDRMFRDNASGDDVPKVVVWLSDGDADDWDKGARDAVKKVMDQGVAIRSLIFKAGNSDKVKQVGIEPFTVDGSPSDLMKAFADAFRYIVQAPFRADGVVAKDPKFTIKPHMEDVWVVTYGDESLSAASVTHDGKAVPADYAADHYNGSAYRVAHMKNPAEGTWEVSVTGGGPGVSYAVIQRSTITPYAEVAKDVTTGVAFPLVVGLRYGDSGQDLQPSDLPEPVKIEAQFNGQTIELHDDGSNGDAKAGDGKFTAMLTALNAGPVMIRVRAHNSFLDRVIKVTVNARGFFKYSGGPVDVNFGSVVAGQTVCRVVQFQAEQQGGVPFELRQLDTPPDGLHFELRAKGKRSTPGGDPITLLPGEEKSICLTTNRNAGDSRSDARVWANLVARGFDGTPVPLRMTWSVRALTFWEKWRNLILLILAALIVFFIVYGYIKPYRFPAGLAICYAPEMSELDDQTPQPVRMWRGVGIGFYRDARACLQDNYRITGTVRGAVATLHAGQRRIVYVRPGSRALYREEGLGEWEQIPPNGRRASMGEIYRVGDNGPFFRLSMRASS
jgi:hypothetical protein